MDDDDGARKAHIHHVRAMIRRGDYVGVFGRPDLLDPLKRLQTQPATSEAYLQSAALLAEVHDQISLYAQAEAFLRGDDVDEILKRLSKAAELSGPVSAADDPLREPPDRELTQEQKKQVRLYNAYGFYLLQVAITHTRHQNHGAALELLGRTAGALVGLQQTGMRFQGVLAALYYWMGRTELERRLPTADAWFSLATRLAARNLQAHYRLHRRNGHSSSGTSDNSDVFTCPKCSERRSWAHYVTASAMAFGHAVQALERGELNRARSLLEPACLMLEAHTVDRYRIGYCHLLLGMVSRERAGLDIEALKAALRGLTEAKTRFAPTHGHAHIYYEARVYHELSLTHLALSRAYRLDPTTRDIELKKAVATNREARAAVEHQSSLNRISYKDVSLGWESSLALSEILAESSDWDGARAAAASIISAQRRPPAHILARAWIARAKVYLGMVATLDGGDMSGRIERLSSARNALREALKVANGNLTLQLTAHLYLARVAAYSGDTVLANQILEREWLPHAERIERLSLRQLAEDVADSLPRRTTLLLIDFENILNKYPGAVFAKCSAHLRRRAVEWAIARGASSQKEICEILKIDRATLKKWAEAADFGLTLPRGSKSQSKTLGR